MTDEERIDDAYERIDIDTDEILAFYDRARVERCLKSIWDSAVTMHQIATVALKENAKLREACTDAYRAICKMYVRIDGEWNYGDAHADPTYGPILRRMRKLGIEVKDD